MFLTYLLWFTARERLSSGGESDRGDLPGWILVTVMTAAVVVVLIPFVGPVIAKAFSHAVNSVTGTSSGTQ